MATKISMEALSPTMEEGRVVKWNKNEGDAVKSGESLAEVETDKAIMELVARGDGVLRKRLVNEGESRDRKSTRLNSSHSSISYAVFCLKKKKKKNRKTQRQKKTNKSAQLPTNQGHDYEGTNNHTAYHLSLDRELACRGDIRIDRVLRYN